MPRNVNKRKRQVGETGTKGGKPVFIVKPEERMVMGFPRPKQVGTKGKGRQRKIILEDRRNQKT